MIFRRQLLSLVALLYTSAGALGYPACEKAPVGDCTYPSLINATSDQLQDGLSKGCFTSADLVKVCFRPLLQLDMANCAIGVRRKNPRGQLDPAHGVGNQFGCDTNCPESRRGEEEREYSRVCHISPQ